jgi:hypothetical protein
VPALANRRVIPRGALLLAAALLVPAAASAQSVVVPQTGMSTCPELEVAWREEAPAGARIAVSPDGRWLALLAHTPGGGEVRLRDRFATCSGPAAARVLPLHVPGLPTGVNWRIYDAEFSPDSRYLAVRGTGSISVFDAAAGGPLFSLEKRDPQPLFPGSYSMAAGALIAALWPAESFLADAAARGPVEMRMVDAASGKWLRSLMLPLGSSAEWTRIALSPDAARLAVLLRPRRWPGKARLTLYATSDAKVLWEQKVAAEDLAWSADGGTLLALGSRLIWLDAGSGKPQREADTRAGSSEFHLLRASTPAGFAVGRLSRFARLRRMIGGRGERETLLLVWRLGTGRAACQIPLPPELSVEPWPTERGEIVALEETYEVKPELRLLRTARIVTYTLRPEKKDPR